VSSGSRVRRLVGAFLRAARHGRAGRDGAHLNRFGLGRFNTEDEVDYVIDLVAQKVKKLREMSPLWEMAQSGVDINGIQWAGQS